jgi:tetratricopeptide (TPR) repeat protein
MRKLLLVTLFTALFQFGAIAQSVEFQQGISSANSGDFQAALVHFQQSEAKSAQIHYNIGACFYRLNQPNKAVIEFQKAIELAPNSGRLFYALGMTFVDLKNFSEAESAFLKAIRLDEKNGETWFDLALVFYEQKKFDESIVAFRNAIKFKSVAKSVSYNNIGVIHSLQGDNESAIKQIEIALKLNVPEAKTNLEILRNIANEPKLTAKLIILEKK